MEEYTLLQLKIIHPSVTIGKGTYISPTAVLEEGCTVGDNCFIGHYTVMRPNTHIGNNVKIGHLCVFEGNTTIGNDTTIQSQSHITRGATISDKVFIGPGFIGVNDRSMTHLRHDVTPFVEEPFSIGHGSRIGSGSILLPRVRIGSNCVIGCGAVVTKDIEDNTIALGVPAEPMGNVPEKERI